MLILSRRVNQHVRIGETIDILVTGIRDGVVRLGIEAPKEIPVHREEVYTQIHAADAPAIPREFEPDPRPTGDAEHFVREGLKALTMSCDYSSEDAEAIGAALNIAFDKFHKALTLLAAGTPPVVHPGG